MKAEIYRVAERYGLKVYVVSNSYLNVPRHPRIELVVVSDSFDAADNWIAERAGPGDIVVAAEVRLHPRIIEQSVDRRGGLEAFVVAELQVRRELGVEPGAEAAAQTYFHQTAATLSPVQSALLAGAIVNPRLLNPAHPTKRLLQRQQLILRRMGAVSPPPVPAEPVPPVEPVEPPPAEATSKTN